MIKIIVILNTYTCIKRYILDQHCPSTVYFMAYYQTEIWHSFLQLNNIEQNNYEIQKQNIKHVTIDLLAKYVRVYVYSSNGRDIIQKNSLLLDILFRKTSHSSYTSSCLALSLQDLSSCT